MLRAGRQAPGGGGTEMRTSSIKYPVEEINRPTRFGLSTPNLPPLVLDALARQGLQITEALLADLAATQVSAG